MPVVARLLLLTLLLALLPILTWLSGWHWQVDDASPWLRPLYWLTLTGSAPFAIGTTALVLVLLYRRLGWRPAELGRYGLCLCLALLAGLGAKALLKWHFKEARPYVQYLDNTHDTDFYQDSIATQKRLIDTAPVPAWLKGHWRHERGYAFPSGHTQFAAMLALFSAILLWQARAWLAMSLVLAWALLVMASRLLLGMHWPQDLLFSLSFAWLLVWPALVLAGGNKTS
ncbi:phosphatase PAP2 family protein [Gallaecimonas pentaromativorans]|uniref:phosphatase PAP2 family protein n=1 Tax=Gallaecimonas pentaromativorans TaxID=584787 RepID=UPI003A91956D